MGTNWSAMAYPIMILRLPGISSPSASCRASAHAFSADPPRASPSSMLSCIFSRKAFFTSTFCMNAFSGSGSSGVLSRPSMDTRTEHSSPHTSPAISAARALAMFIRYMIRFASGWATVGAGMTCHGRYMPRHSSFQTKIP